MSQPDIQLGFYEHYKSTPEKPMLYEVIGLAKHSETDEILVVYIPQYESEWVKPATMCVRPYKMFVELVEYNGQQQSRFRHLSVAKTA